MSDPFSESGGIPVNEASPVTAYWPVVIPVAGREVDLHVRVSAPSRGSDLPVLVFSHGNGYSNFLNSFRGYGPLVDFLAAHGFVVLQPTHLDWMGLGLRDARPEGPLFWRSRILDARHVLDRLDEIEAAVPAISGRLDRDRVAAVGHSMGGHTVAALCGQTCTDPDDGSEVQLADDRIAAGVILGAPGRGEDLAPAGYEHGWGILGSTRFDKMTTPVLVVNGTSDYNPMFSERRDWRRDAYDLSPAPKSLLSMIDAEHSYGGVAGWDADETTDENPEWVAGLRGLIWAYLRSELYSGDPAWPDAVAAMAAQPRPLGHTETK